MIIWLFFVKIHGNIESRYVLHINDDNVKERRKLNDFIEK